MSNQTEIVIHENKKIKLQTVATNSNRKKRKKETNNTLIITEVHNNIIGQHPSKRFQQHFKQNIHLAK